VLQDAWNRTLGDHGVSLRFTGSFRHTGNYLLNDSTVRPVSEVTHILSQYLRITAAIFAAPEFLRWLEELHRAQSFPPRALLGRRPTLGVVMDADASGGEPPRPPSDHRVAFGDFVRPRVREVWKFDLLLPPDFRKLDPRQREGGWGSVAEAMNRARNGLWTARSLTTLDGLAEMLGSREFFPPADFTLSELVMQDAIVERDSRTPLRQLLAGTPLERSGTSFLNAATTVDAGIHARRLAESAVRILVAKAGLGPGTFFESLRLLTTRGLLSERAATYFHTIRRLGNAAVHGEHDAHLTEEDVEVISRMLLIVLREVVEQSGKRDG
jgi:uncharacterized protein DUF4145